MLLSSACSGDYFERVSYESDTSRGTAPTASTATGLQATTTSRATEFEKAEPMMTTVEPMQDAADTYLDVAPAPATTAVTLALAPVIAVPPTAAPEGTVTVTVSGLEDAAGKQLVGFLFEGPATMSYREGIGVFGIDIDTDAFSTSQVMRRPDEYFGKPFPYVSDDILTVQPGTYTIHLWLAPALSPYNRWVPADTEDLTGCIVGFDVEEGHGATVMVDSSQFWTHSIPAPGDQKACGWELIE